MLQHLLLSTCGGCKRTLSACLHAPTDLHAAHTPHARSIACPGLSAPQPPLQVTPGAIAATLPSAANRHVRPSTAAAMLQASLATHHHVVQHLGGPQQVGRRQQQTPRQPAGAHMQHASQGACGSHSSAMSWTSGRQQQHPGAPQTCCTCPNSMCGTGAPGHIPVFGVAPALRATCGPLQPLSDVPALCMCCVSQAGKRT